MNYINDYMSNTDYLYLENKLDNNIKEILKLNQFNVKNNLNYLQELNLNIFEIFLYRIDLIICNNEVLKEKIEKIKNIINNINVLDYILFGI